MHRAVAVSTSIHLLAFSYLAVAATSDPVIVTATRTAETADAALASVTVITREDLERLQTTSVSDALRGVPGLGISNSGGPGKVTSVYLRGTDSDQVLVLIDGVKVGSATLGTTAFQDIPIEQIERIEIVRGPRSSLYGSEAIGGVIQIFTRRGGGTTRPYFSIGTGSFDTFTTSAGLAGGGDQGWFNVSASGASTQGFNACRGQPGAAGCFVDEPETDGYRNASAGARAGYRFGNGAEIDINALRARGKAEFDGFPNESTSIQQVLGGRLRFAPSAPWHVTLAAGRNWDELANDKDGVFFSRFDTQRDTLSIQNDLSLAARHLVTFGADYQEDRVSSSEAFSTTSRDNQGIFAQYQAGFGANDMQFSVRQDDNDQFGHHATGGIAWGRDVGNQVRLVASYGTAFKAPTFNELYFPTSSFSDGTFTYITHGNPNLDPETSKSAELAIRYAPPGGTSLGLALHHTRIRDAIDWTTMVTGPTELTTEPQNVDRARIRGLEATAGTRLYQWNLRGSMTLLDPENQTEGSNDGKMLPRRAEKILRVDLDRSLGHYRFGATVFAESERFDDLANTTRLAGYGILDLRAEYIHADAWRLQARLENVLDKDYETAAFFNQPGRSVYLTLRYQP